LPSGDAGNVGPGHAGTARPGQGANLPPGRSDIGQPSQSDTAAPGQGANLPPGRGDIGQPSQGDTAAPGHASYGGLADHGPQSHAFVAAVPVLAAGVGLRRGRGWAMRSASFRVGAPEPGGSALGMLVDTPATASAIVDMLAGVARPAHGELRVLGHDMRTIRGRTAVRRRVGVARRGAVPLLAPKIRGLVEHAARLASPDRQDRQVLAAAILDRLGLVPWADVPVRAAPDSIARRARLAAAAVHQPELLLVDGLMDGFPKRDVAGLADAIRDLCRDSGVLVVGCDSAGLALACDDILVLTDGVLSVPPGPPALSWAELESPDWWR
jgi:ABC-type Na+ transport system ATPase subunit NatA